MLCIYTRIYTYFSNIIYQIGKKRKCKRNQKPLFNFYLMKVFDQEYERKLNGYDQGNIRRTH